MLLQKTARMPLLLNLLYFLQQSPRHESTDEQVGGMQNVLAAPVVIALILLVIVTVGVMLLRKRKR